jgi:hypothetical protein
MAGLRVSTTLTPSTPFATPQVFSRRFASSDSAFPQVSTILVARSIPGSSTRKGPGQRPFFRLAGLTSTRHQFLCARLISRPKAASDIISEALACVIAAR